ncbi:MAG: c-type cytochrome [Thiobacillus sp.]
MRPGRSITVLTLLAACAPALAAGEYDRALRVDVAVLQGDARLLADPATPAVRRAGLRARIASTLGTLGMTAREAGNPGPASPQILLPSIAALRTDFHRQRPDLFLRRATSLAMAFPLDTAYFIPLVATPLRARTGQSIYRQLCIGCHQYTDPKAANPAPDLFAMARSTPPAEFVARMLGGIHGVPRTTLKNPFSDEEIASLLVYFSAGKP